MILTKSWPALVLARSAEFEGHADDRFLAAADRADARRAMETLGLSPDERKPVGRYSLGMRQRLGFAQAIMENPDVLVLDEPFNAMDRDAMEEVHALLRQFREAGKTILLASHSAADIAKACDIVYEMEDGRLRRAVPAERN